MVCGDGNGLKGHSGTAAVHGLQDRVSGVVASCAAAASGWWWCMTGRGLRGAIVTLVDCGDDSTIGRTGSLLDCVTMAYRMGGLTLRS